MSTTSVMSRPKSGPKERIREAFSDSLKGVELWGSVVTFDSGHSDKTFLQVRDALTKAGFDPAVARELTPRSAFARAAKRLSEERVIDIIREDQEEVVFQFSKKNLLAKEEPEYEYTKEHFVRLNKITGKITCVNDQLRDRAQTEVDRCLEMRTTSDITRIVYLLMEKQADLIPLRKQGGTYFVPEKCVGIIDQVDTFLNEFGGEVIRMPVPKGTPYGDKAVQKNMAEYLNDMMKQLEQAVEGFSSSTREDTIKSTAEKINTTRAKIEGYALYLEDRKNDLLAFVEEVNKKLLTKIAEVSTEKKDQPLNYGASGKAFSIGNALLEKISDKPKHVNQLIVDAKIPLLDHDYAKKWLYQMARKGKIKKEGLTYSLIVEEVRS